MKTLLFTIISAGLFFFGCQNSSDMGLVGPDNSGQVKQAKTLSVVKLPESTMPRPLHKVIKAMITPESGGVIHYTESYQAVTGQQVDVDMQLRFPPGAVDDTMEVSIDVSRDELTGDIGMDFGPSPTTFNKPALLTFSVTGLDSTDLPSDPNLLQFVYDNDGSYVPMSTKKISVDLSKGELKVQEGELPHFSRYAWAT